MQLHPYLNFDGRCEEAIEFYRKALGAMDVSMRRFSEAPGAAAGSKNKVMHAVFRIGDTTIFASDGDCKGHAKFDGFSISITVANAAEADRLFAALNDGGTTIMPLSETFFSPRFGMLTDRFGVSWMIYLPR